MNVLDRGNISNKASLSAREIVQTWFEVKEGRSMNYSLGRAESRESFILWFTLARLILEVSSECCCCLRTVDKPTFRYGPALGSIVPLVPRFLGSDRKASAAAAPSLLRDGGALLHGRED